VRCARALTAGRIVGCAALESCLVDGDLQDCAETIEALLTKKQRPAES